MPSSFFGIFLVIALFTAVVFGIAGFSLPLIGAELTGASTWGWNTFSSIERGYTIRYPQDFSVDIEYVYDRLGRSKEIRGVAFSVPKSIQGGTTLASGTYISFEEVPHVANCGVGTFLYKPQAKRSFVEGDRIYSFGIEREVKGNFIREERVYALPDTSPCLGIRYTIHSTLPGTETGPVKQFDYVKLFGTFDAMRQSFGHMK